MELRGADNRETDDVDLVYRGSYAQLALLQEDLRRQGFVDVTTGEVRDRMRYEGVAVDLATALNTPGLQSNRWYERAFANSRWNETFGIYVIDPIHFLATKVAALDSRGVPGSRHIERPGGHRSCARRPPKAARLAAGPRGPGDGGGRARGSRLPPPPSRGTVRPPPPRGARRERRAVAGARDRDPWSVSALKRQPRTRAYQGHDASSRSWYTDV